VQVLNVTGTRNHMTSYAVELSGVTKRFGTYTAVRNLDLKIPEGAIYGFIGPNGSGKTTTIRMILRIFHPDEGEIRVLGQSHGDCADDRVGYLPEERGLYRKMRVRDLLRYYGQLKGFPDTNAAINKWLHRLGADDWGPKRIESLSKGMAQKVQFIAAVIAEPQLLILDEPFTGLDPVNLDLLRGALLELREQGTTIIFSTHEMDAAERLCDDVFMIHKGDKVLDGPLDQIQRQYPADQVKVRVAQGQTLPGDLPGVDRTEHEGAYAILRLTHPESADRLLNHIAARCRLEHFELIRPSLHNIFIRIAGPVTTDSSTTASA
jgi:ABC-2 type transport system ATP-binding protein